MSYFLAPAGLKLWTEVRTRFPGRDAASDGWIGDASHAARPSDHNPCWSCSGSSYGIVRAVDLDGDGWPAEACVQYLLARCRSGAERRVAYIIYKRRIWSVTYGWTQRYYSGTNPHDAHFHVSLKRDSSNFSTLSWLPTFPSNPAPPPPEDDMPYSVAQLEKIVADNCSRALQAWVAGQTNMQFTSDEVAAIKAISPSGGVLGELVADVAQIKSTLAVLAAKPPA